MPCSPLKEDYNTSWDGPYRMAQSFHGQMDSCNPSDDWFTLGMLAVFCIGFRLTIELGMYLYVKFKYKY